MGLDEGFQQVVIVSTHRHLVALVEEDTPTNAGDERDVGSIPGSGRSPRGEHGDPLQYSCLENPMDREEPGGLPSMGSQRIGQD